MFWASGPTPPSRSPKFANACTADEEVTMPKYQMYFDTIKGETRYNVDIDDAEVHYGEVSEIQNELRESGND